MITFEVSALLIFGVSIIHIQLGSDISTIVDEENGEARMIPKNNIEAVHRVVEVLGQKEIERFRELSRVPEENMDQLLRLEFESFGHHGLGMDIRNNFGFWEDSRLSRWYSWRGYRHPDSKSGPILDGFKALVLEGKNPTNLFLDRLFVLTLLSLCLTFGIRLLLILGKS